LDQSFAAEEKMIKDERRVSSLDAPMTSPDMPPKLLFEM